MGNVLFSNTSNMAADRSQIQVRENEVLLFKNGQPVLRVERGTTLRIIKLLYQADQSNKGTVIGLRPQTDDPLPCLLTLDQSHLEHARYEIIALEQTPEVTNENTKETSTQKRLNTYSPSFQNNCVDGSTSRQEQPQEVTNEPKETALPGAIPTGSHTMPLMVNVSPDAGMNTIHDCAAANSSSSLLVTRKSTSPSRSSMFSFSRRKRTARKSVLPRKISPVSSPNHSIGKRFHTTRFQRGAIARSTKLILRGNTVELEVPSNPKDQGKTIDSSGLCDSTENENLEMPRGEEEIFDEEPGSDHQEKESGSSGELSLSFPTEDSANFPNCHSLDGSSTNGSSPSISEGHLMVVDVSDSRETSGGENDSDTNLIGCENSPLRNQNALSQSIICSAERVATLDGSQKEVLHVSEGDNNCTHNPTAIVVLENTVKVKMEPKEVVVSHGSSLHNQNGPSPNLSFNSNEEASSMSENHCESRQFNLMPSSLEDGHCSSLPLDQRPTLVPKVIDIIGTSPESNLTEQPEHHHHTGVQHLDSMHNCDVCQKQFDSPNSFQRHKRSHTGERPYICKICGWGFNLSGNLNQHLAIHQKVKPFKCVYCGKTFARSNVLKAHVRCHTGERPFQCDICGSKFIIGHNLKKHMMTRHGIKDDDKIFSQNNIQGENGNSNSPRNGDLSDNPSLPVSQ